MLALHDKAKAAGFEPGDPIEMGPCGFHRHHTYAIDPEGHIYKCPGFLGKSEWAIGHLSTGLTSRYEAMLGYSSTKHCGGCSHQPNCTGGCVATAFLKAGRVEGINCEKDFFDSQKDEIIKRKYAFEVAGADGGDPFEHFEAMAWPSPGGAQGRRSAALRVVAA